MAKVITVLSAFGLMAAAADAGHAQVSTEITIGGQSFASLVDAAAVALAGDTIMVGEGTVRLDATLVLGDGVHLEGVSAASTLIDATGLAVGVHLVGGGVSTGGGGTSTHSVGRLQIFGAGRGIEVTGARGVIIRNVVLLDNHESGLFVAEDAEATLVNATLVRNGAGVTSSGTARVRNTIVTGGGDGLVATRVDGLISSYNDMFANSGATYRQVLRGTGDISFVASFVAFGESDFRLTDRQAITDRGDPTDDFSGEPEPNGRRVNLGAFGNTSLAEFSVLMPPQSGAGGGCAVSAAGEKPSHTPAGASVMLIAGIVALLRGRRRFRCLCRISRAGYRM